MINGDRSTVQITPFGPAPVRKLEGRWSLEDSLECEMLMYKKHQRKPAEHNVKVQVMVYFSVDGKTLYKISTAIDSKDYFGYVAIENFVSELVRPTLEAISKKILEVTGDKELAEYIIGIDQFL